jgi:hypothetical protein
MRKESGGTIALVHRDEQGEVSWEQAMALQPGQWTWLHHDLEEVGSGRWGLEARNSPVRVVLDSLQFHRRAGP